MTEHTPHPAGDIAFSGLEKDYEKARPSYPDEALDHLCYRCPNPAPPFVLDVGCGTGKLTRQLAAQYPSARISGCDANADMVAQACAATSDDRIEYFVSPAETLPIEAGGVGLLTVAQAVQWFDRPAFFAEAVRILAPKGVLALIENNRDWRTSAFLDAYEALLEANAPGYSRFYRNHDYADELVAAGFGEAGTHSVRWLRHMEPDIFIQMARSSTRMQAALRSAGESVIAELEELLNHHMTAKCLIEVPYLTQIWWAVA